MGLFGPKPGPEIGMGMESAPKVHDYIEGKIVQEPSPIEEYPGMLFARVYVFNSADRDIQGKKVELLMVEGDPDATISEMKDGTNSINAKYDLIYYESHKIQATKGAVELIKRIDSIGREVDQRAHEIESSELPEEKVAVDNSRAEEN